LSLLLLILNVLPYFLPWFYQEATVYTHADSTEVKIVYVGLFKAWVPSLSAGGASTKMSLADYIDLGCPGIDTQIILCSALHSF